jgi:hypothetical protein
VVWKRIGRKEKRRETGWREGSDEQNEVDSELDDGATVAGDDGLEAEYIAGGITGGKYVWHCLATFISSYLDHSITTSYPSETSTRRT